MSYRDRYGKINVKLIVILVLVTAALGVSLVAARQIRRSILSKTSLAAGEAAYEKEDWPAATKNLREYLGRNPDDIEILKKYAKALMKLRPLETPAVAGAISAYRRVLQVDPNDASASKELASLYTATRQFEDLAYIARMRLSHDATDLEAPLWLAEALFRLNKAPEAKTTLEDFIARLEKSPADANTPARYVRACVGLSQIVLATDSAAARAEALKLLDKAVGYASQSAEALAQRARFYRETSDIAGVNDVDRQSLARKDLEAADALNPADPRTRYALGAEWMMHGELDRAAAELQAIDKLSPEELAKHYFDINDWKVARFLFASELATRRGALAEAAALAEDTLKALPETETRLRLQVLPAAIPLYLDRAVNKVSEARKCLNEYLGMVRSQRGAAESPQKVALLQATVEMAEKKPYAVIDTLQPVAVAGPINLEMLRIWGLLATAYSQTNQTGRAINALLQCLQANPRN